jgi:hypothetical protein
MLHYTLHVSTVSMLADPLQPTWTFRITKKGNLLMEHTDLGILSAMHGGHSTKYVSPSSL